MDLELATAPTPAPAELDVEELELEDNPNRVNRYSTKFGTSEGFDEGMLRELRVLQRAREDAEAQNRRQARERTATIDVEQLAPIEVVADTVAVAEAPIEVVEVKAPVEIIKQVQAPVETMKTVEKVEAPVEVVEERTAPVVAPPTPVKKKASPKW